MPQINPSLPVVGQPNSTEEPKVVSALSALVGAVNTVDSAQIVDGSIQPVDLQAALADVLGVNVGATNRRGRNVPTNAEITFTSTSFATHANDADITVTQPTNGVTLFIASVDGHSNSNVVNAEVAVRVDGTTDVFLASFLGSTYSTQNVVVPQNRPGAHTYRFAYRVAQAGTAFFASRSLFIVTLGL